jgi:serine/threonine protein kinase/WD40 repeat protein
MTPDRFRELERLYHAARARPDDQRAGFLAEACASDAALQAEVESMLASEPAAAGFMSTPAVDSGMTGPAASFVGRRLGPYAVESPLGMGGMGEVYRARDSKLGRDVAIKILPRIFTSDSDRLARFEREARLLASLNHPNIGAIYGLQDVDGIPALVLELIEGDTLAERLARGGLPVSGSSKPRDPRGSGLPLGEVLTIARQIAAALEAAHEKGIVHRDLKPANIKITPAGVVKVLDFGLAKYGAGRAGWAGAGSGAEAERLTNSPTLTSDTREGVILGTAAYMSPEQAQGHTADTRSDIWAFGVVLYETLTGKSGFGGDTAVEVLSNVLKVDPDWTALPASAPPSIRSLLRRCLQKDPRQRLRDIADARFQIEETLNEPATALVVAERVPVAQGRERLLLGAHGRRWRAACAIALGLLAGVTGWFLAHRSAFTTSAAVVRLSIPSLEPPFRSSFGSPHLAISADGSRVAYASASRLWIRRLGQKEAVAIDVASSSNPFFSPNGEWVGFFDAAGGGLRKVPALGGTPVQIVTTSARPSGGTWRADGTIVFATSGGLYQVSENGGEPRLLVKPDPRRKERAYAWPQFTPDGRSVLFTMVPNDSIEGAQIEVLDLNTLKASVVLKGGSAARYASTGHLVYASEQTLKAIAFDPVTQQTRGDPVSLPDIEVATTPDNGAAEFAVSETGTLLFITPNVLGQGLRTLAWVDREGKEEALALAPGRYANARISPDGTRIALDIPGANRDIWIWNLQRPGLTRLTSGPTEDMVPVWSRDGRRVFFASNRAGNGKFDVYSQAADGATMDRVEFAGPSEVHPISFTPDGTRLIVTENFNDLSVLTLARPDRLEPLLHSPFNEWLAEVSPDGNWLAYESDESGNQVEIFLRPFPNVFGRKEKVSIDGGRYPLWGPKDSGELFYVDLKGRMMSASVKLSPSLSLGRVTKLFDGEKPPRGTSGRRYDISPIDGRFLMIKPATDASSGAINISVVLNWFTELQQRVPTR